MKTFVRMFKPQFAPLVESGRKLQTVRPTPKRMPVPGDKISLRAWTGRPYRSKQRVLCESEFQSIAIITIAYSLGKSVILLDGRKLVPLEVEKFAQKDGFKNSEEMVEWFYAEHGLPFTGVVLYWKPKMDGINGKKCATSCCYYNTEGVCNCGIICCPSQTK